MPCMTRCIFRWGLITALALGGATLLIGPERVAAGLAHVRAKAQSVVDLAVDNPAVLRRQLDDLAEEYPHRIAKVQGELAEVQRQIDQFERDSEVSSRVITMTTEDLGELKTLIARADGVSTNGRPVFVRFEGVRFHVDQAKNEAQRIHTVRTTYGDRLACNQQQLAMLNQQNSRLGEILVRLEDEFATFETQMWQLDRQIDAIERNDRLIEMTQQLQSTLSGYDRWGKLDNLKQLQAKLVELETIQVAQLDMLAKLGIRNQYEDRARYELEVEQAPVVDPFADDHDENETSVEIGAAADSVAWLGPVIVE